MSKCNYNFDPFVANASAALYGVENQNAVQENSMSSISNSWSILGTQNSSANSIPSRGVDKLP